MPVPLNVLIVEDSEDDTLILLRQLRQGGYDVSHLQVETAEAMAAALEEQEWDVILSDHAMPQFSATAALALLQKQRIDLPFIIISGTIGEETAVSAMKAGAHDFMTKGNLARLIPAVERELRDAEERRKRRQAENEILSISEREQTRVGRDLHDGVCQTLVAVMLMADGLAKNLSAGNVPPGMAAEQVRDLSRLVKDAIEETRALARGLYVVRLEDRSLSVALGDLATTCERHFNISCVVKSDKGAKPRDNHEATHIYRIAQEAVSNAVKHGKAQSVEIELSSRPCDATMLLSIKDDGVGLPVQALSEGMGLKTMAYRAQSLGGSLAVRNRPEGGAEVVCTLPLRCGH